MHPAEKYLFCGVCSLALLGTMPSAYAAADTSYVSAMRYVSLDAHGDDAGSRQYSGTGSFTLGNYTWLQGTLGKLTDDSANGLGDLQSYGVGAGVKGEHLQLGVNFSHYRNGANYKQRDLSTTFDWLAEKFSLGVDLSRRTIDNSYDFAITDTYPLLGTTTISTHAEEQLVGNGIGAHGSLNLTDQFSVSLGGMSYDYDRDTAISANVTATQYALLAQILERRINNLIQDGIARRSGSTVTRAVVPLASSYNLGMSYLFDSVGLSAQYLRDKNLDSDVVTDTLSLNASVFIGEHWMIAPTIGQSHSDVSGDIAFGGLSLSYNW